MRRIVLSFGLIAGAMLSVMMLLTLPFLDQIGFDKGEVIGYTTMVLAFLMVFFGVKSYRDNVAGGLVDQRGNVSLFSCRKHFETDASYSGILCDYCGTRLKVSAARHTTPR